MAEPVPPHDAGHRILVVDDDPATEALIRSSLGDRPFEVLAAADGENGLRLAAESRPDVILLDLRLPGADGIEIARRLREQPETLAIPIIVISACRDTDAKVRALAAGADDYVTKPFDVAEIDARIQTMIRTRARLAGMEASIEDLQATNRHLEQLLMIDEKTGLLNFRTFQRRLNEEWQRAERYQTPLSLVFFDLDHFKNINDTLGHQEGDRALVEFATLVTGGARANDVSARYGGEEFAVILPHTDGAMAVRVAERVRAAVAEFVFLADTAPTRITVSAGVATYPSLPAIDSVDALVRAADAALYRAKDAGRDCVVHASDRAEKPSRKRDARPTLR
jgi:diguanylate cyclase (GGDEF)-like protein